MEQEISLLSLRKLAEEPRYSDVSLSPVERVRALGKMGRSVEVDQDLNPRLYLRSGLDMERMASVYHQEGRLENAYVLYNKFITLFVEKLPLHKDYSQCGSSPEKVLILKKLQDEAFPRRDELKTRLEEKYSSEYEEYKGQSAVEGRGLQLQRASLLAEDPGGRTRLSSDGCGGRGQWLEAERQRVADLRKRQMESEQFLRFEEQLQRQERANQKPEAALTVSDAMDGSCLSLRPVRASAQPQRAGPTRALVQSAVVHCPEMEGLRRAEGLHRADGLRRVVLPRDLTLRFLRLAESNTIRGTETCGVLCGRLSQDELLVSHVVVPKQTSGPDFCDMENVEELFQIQDQHELLTLGWIHTHPTQTSFLSSVDLHTHCSFQLMLPEAIAVVCAPRHRDVGVFRLTEAGVAEVSRCRLKGFHPHSKDPPLYTACRHVLLRDCALRLLDLR